MKSNLRHDSSSPLSRVRQRRRTASAFGGGGAAYRPEETLDWSRYAGSRLRDFRKKMETTNGTPAGVLTGTHGA